MRGIRTSIPKLAAAVLAAASACAATPDLFPLEAGNSWVYRAEGRLGTQAGSIEVLRAQSVGGAQYFATKFFNRRVLLRVNEAGSLLSYDSSTRTEKLWVPLHADAGATFDTAIDDCTRSGRIESRTEPYKGTVGPAAEAVTVVFEPKCADAGVTRAVFVPGVGLAEYETTSIAGPVTYKLVYARTGVTVRAQSELSFGISTDSSTYTRTGVLAVRLTLRNTSREAVRLEFPSSQDYDVQIRDDKGEIVYTWSADKLFAAVFRTIDFGPGERNWLVEIPLDSLAPGKYTVEGSLATNPRNYAATTSIDVRAGN